MSVPNDNLRAIAPLLMGIAERELILTGKYSSAVRPFFKEAGASTSRDAISDWFGRQDGWPERAEKALATRRELFAAGAQDTLTPDAQLARRFQQLQTEHGVLKAQLGDLHELQTLAEQIADVIKETVVPLRLPAAPKLEASKGRHPVDMVVTLSDEHADEVITGPATWGLERYDFRIFRARLERWAQLIAEYAQQHLPKHDVQRLWVFKLGDSQHGDIHGNKHRNAFGNSVRAAVAIADAEAEALAYLTEYFPGGIHVVSVPGNHPRLTMRKDHVDPHDNFDYLITAMIAQRLRSFIDAGRLTVHAPRSWTAYVDVRGKLMSLNHGDDVVGTWGIPWYGFSRKHARVQALVGQKDQRVDFFWHGHFHQDIASTENGARSIHTGAFTWSDAWTTEAVGGGGEPHQAAAIFDDRSGMRRRRLGIPLWLRDPEREKLVLAGEVEPRFGKHVTLDLLGQQADVKANAGAFPKITATTRSHK